MAAKHTPRAWKVEEFEPKHHSHVRILDEKGIPITSCEREKAYLLAAAPELLEACMTVLDSVHGEKDTNWTEVEKALWKCREAVAKAEGSK